MGACLGKSKSPAPAPKKAEQTASAAAPAPETPSAPVEEQPAATEAAKPAEEATETKTEETPAAEEAPKTEDAAPAETPAAEASESTTTPAGETVNVEQPKEPETPVEAAVAAVTAAVAGEKKKPKVVIVYYSMYGHVKKMAETAAEGAKSVEDVDVDIYQVPETLPQEVLDVMNAPPKGDHPVLTHDMLDKLVEADGILFGVPTRFGMLSAQMKAFFDGTGGLWAKGALAGKLGGCFVSTATQGGGQESTLFTVVTQFAHHGMLFVPIAYTLGAALYNNEETRGGSVYGAGTIAASDGSRMPSDLELDNVRHQGKLFAETVKRYVN